MRRPSIPWLCAFSVALALGCRASRPEPEPPRPEPPGTSLAPLVRKVPPGTADEPRLALGARGAVTSAQADATQVGLEVLRAGGNAVDAAVAVGLALAVTHPSAGNLGGGGFMLVRMGDGRVAAIDYRERAPGKASRDMYLDAQGNPTRERLDGPKAAGIPGTVAGLALAHERFGTLPWRDLVMPAVKLAEEGHRLDRWHAEDLGRGAGRMKEVGQPDSAALYLRPDGTPYAEGELWRQPDLARTLRAIAEDGSKAFYGGKVAEQLVAGVTAAGGIWQQSDLTEYRAREREPIVFQYRDHEILTMPPPSAGGVVLRQLFAAAETLDLASKPWRSVEELHLYVEAARRTYADRNLLLGDPDFVDLPMRELLDVTYVAQRMADIDPHKATPSSAIGAGLPVREESVQTTHFSVVDEAGGAVSNTYTLNTGFGSKFVAPGTGVLLNNEMDDFAVKPGTPNVFGLVQGEQNKIEPGKRMLSSMTPTIVLEHGRLRAVVGTPGGPTITTTVFQIIHGIIDYGLTIEAAVAAPRVHHQWQPDQIWAEDTLPEDVKEGLRALGHQVGGRGSMGHANCIEVEPKSQGFRAVADVERDGGAAGAW